MLNIPQNIIEESKTPLYFYDLQLLHRTLDEAQRCAGDFCVHYAVKANANARILQEIASRGFGADCVSGGEVKAAVAAGFAPEKIVFAGVGKTDDEIRTALSLCPNWR
jgi:diaminopimelate decarboxylase